MPPQYFLRYFSPRIHARTQHICFPDRFSPLGRHLRVSFRQQLFTSPSPSVESRSAALLTNLLKRNVLTSAPAPGSQAPSTQRRALPRGTGVPQRGQPKALFGTALFSKGWMAEQKRSRLTTLWWPL